MSKPLATVIEDNLNHANIYLMTLQQVGFDVILFQDVASTMFWLSTTTPSVVILDLHLKDGVGDRILEYIRDDQRFSSTKILLVTADTTATDDIKAMADVTLFKPISVVRLREWAKRIQDNPS